MAKSKVGVLTLLLLCVFLLGSNYMEFAEAQICPQFCEPNVAYMTCPSSGNTKLHPTCTNCCKAGKGCKLFRKDGSLICTGT
ncbi:hypothetical protein RND71_012314 [Anisodus tanguticus]|uniref:Proteinase inhibitor n=1 Tax=Anisodus tanguticus TaxID=243964 RepID=A0AAE1SFI1_9SOLA|nr:hypothetical protein RND71_012314 [Anisodus tanguticus]